MLITSSVALLDNVLVYVLDIAYPYPPLARSKATLPEASTVLVILATASCPVLDTTLEARHR